jgi:hypothetical protein
MFAQMSLRANVTQPFVSREEDEVLVPDFVCKVLVLPLHHVQLLLRVDQGGLQPGANVIKLFFVFATGASTKGVFTLAQFLTQFRTKLAHLVMKFF